MDRVEARSILKRFVLDSLVRGRVQVKLRDDDSFFETELIDSTGVLELVLFLEETFAIRVEDDEIVPDNLDSIDRLVRYVGHKLEVSNPKSEEVA